MLADEGVQIVQVSYLVYGRRDFNNEMINQDYSFQVYAYTLANIGENGTETVVSSRGLV